MQIFAKVKYLCKCFQTAMTPNRDFWNIIAIVIALNSLHNNFDTITASLLKTGDKSIDKIQNILQSKEAKNINKHTTGGTRKLIIVFRNKNDPKQKVFSHKECFNCHKLGHFGRDCPQLNNRQTNFQAHNNLQPYARSNFRRSNTSKYNPRFC